MLSNLGFKRYPSRSRAVEYEAAPPNLPFVGYLRHKDKTSRAQAERPGNEDRHVVDVFLRMHDAGS
jgi:hypothetical protein